jgi:hypothetical protein
MGCGASVAPETPVEKFDTKEVTTKGTRDNGATDVKPTKFNRPPEETGTDSNYGASNTPQKVKAVSNDSTSPKKTPMTDNSSPKNTKPGASRQQSTATKNGNSQKKFAPSNPERGEKRTQSICSVSVVASTRCCYRFLIMLFVIVASTIRYYCNQLSHYFL